MKTDDLINVLSTGIEPIRPGQLRWRNAGAMIVAVAAALASSAVLLKINPSLARMASMPMFWAREAFCLALALSGMLMASRLGRPGRKLGVTLLASALPVAGMWLLAALALTAVAPAARLPLLLGHTARACPFLIALLALPPLAAMLWMLRGMAPTRLAPAGAAAGFAAGASGALAYTLHCPEVAAPFIGVWYLLGMGIATLLGAWCGPRLLRW